MKQDCKLKEYAWYLIPGIQLIILILFLIEVGSLGVLPVIYIALGTLFFVVYNVVLVWVITVRKKVAKLVLSILSIIMSAVLIYGVIAMGKVSKTVDDIVVNEGEITQVSIVVRADSNIDSVEKLSGAKIGITDDTAVKRVAVKINSAVEKKPSYALYKNYVYQINALIDENEDAIVIEDAFLDLLEEYNNYDLIKDTIKVLDTFDICDDGVEPAVFVERKGLEVDNISTNEEDDGLPILTEGDDGGEGTGDTVSDNNAATQSKPNTTYVNTGGIPNSANGAMTSKLDWTNDILSAGSGCFIAYISGIDTLGDVNTKRRSDVNILAVVNTNTGAIQLISTPRDYYVILPNVGQPDKLTHAGLYGVDNSIAALERLYGIKVDYYLRMNFTGFVQIIDTLGGVDVWSDYEFTVDPVKTYTVGVNHLNGVEALAFARERYSFSSGDIQRSKHQMAVIQAMVSKMSSPDILYNYGAILGSISNCIQTSMPADVIYSLVNKQLSTGTSLSVSSYTTTGFNASTTTYTSPNENRYVMTPNDDNVAYAHELIRSALN